MIKFFVCRNNEGKECCNKEKYECCNYIVIVDECVCFCVVMNCFGNVEYGENV